MPTRSTPFYAYLNGLKDEKVLVFFQGMYSGQYKNIKDTVGALDPAFRLVGEDAAGYRRVYATGTGTAAKPADLSIVDPKRPTRISNHVMQAIQATVSF